MQPGALPHEGEAVKGTSVQEQELLQADYFWKQHGWYIVPVQLRGSNGIRLMKKGVALVQTGCALWEGLYDMARHQGCFGQRVESWAIPERAPLCTWDSGH